MKSTPTAAPAAIYEGIAPLHALQNAFRYWWVLAALTALGALAGWGAHLSRPELYESIVRLPIGIDYVSTGPLTQYEEDVAMEVVGGLITSADVMERAAARADAAGFELTPAELRKMAVLERRLNVWELRVRVEGPTAAEQLANIWMEEAYAVVSESYRHAVLADSLMRYARSLETCIARTAASEPVSAHCGGKDITGVQNELVSLSGQIDQEQKASRGLFTGLRIGQPELAAGAEGPQRYGRAGFALAGALIGLILGVVLLETGLINRLFRRP